MSEADALAQIASARFRGDVMAALHAYFQAAQSGAVEVWGCRAFSDFNAPPERILPKNWLGFQPAPVNDFVFFQGHFYNREVRRADVEKLWLQRRGRPRKEGAEVDEFVSGLSPKEWELDNSKLARRFLERDHYRPEKFDSVRQMIGRARRKLGKPRRQTEQK
jgi:hypothetical protein